MAATTSLKLTPGQRKQQVKDEMTKYGKQVVFTIEDLTEIFGFSRMSAYRFVKGMPKIKMNRKYVYFIKDILNKLEFC